MAQAMEKAATRSRIDQSTLVKVLSDGKLKTQIELDYERKMGKNVRVTSGGMNDPDARKHASGDLFGTDVKSADPTKYEYYGYVWDDDFVADFEWDRPKRVRRQHAAI